MIMKKITLALCIDSRGGMTFNNRRQAKDMEVIADMASRFGEGGIFIAPYSAKMFQSFENVSVADSPIDSADDGSLVFIENSEFLGNFDGIETVVIYRFGIPYPADRYFEYDLSSLGYKKISKDKFSTALHKKIEREVYKKVLIN